MSTPANVQMPALSADLELALKLADSADAIALSFFHGRTLAIEEKADSSPVTEADRAVERELRERLAYARPSDGIVGEEYGRSASDCARRWILDPIDGTRNFTRGIPVWGTLIALEEAGQVRLGVVSAPALGRRWWAERGVGAFTEGVPIRVSDVRKVEKAVLSLALDRALPAIAFDAWHARGYGDFWAHMLLAEGGSTASSRTSASGSGTSRRFRSSSKKQAGASPTSLALRAPTAEPASLRTGTCMRRSCRPSSRAAEPPKPSGSDGEPRYGQHPPMKGRLPSSYAFFEGPPAAPLGHFLPPLLEKPRKAGLFCSLLRRS